MAAKTRREFTPEFKGETVALLQGSGPPLTRVAAELGIQPSMVRHWRAAQDGNPLRPCAGQPTRSVAATGLAAPSPADLASENAKLRQVGQQAVGGLQIAICRRVTVKARTRTAPLGEMDLDASPAAGAAFDLAAASLHAGHRAACVMIQDYDFARYL
ncbi:transposase [Belnapia rosea]|uniref:transposase n=1 Tax=Belnapia rosea TaxID=938405 RepID=UPI002108F6EE|nr:transposase [Belnapia rosea]